MANEQCNERLTCLIENCFWVEIYLAIWHKIEQTSNLEHFKDYSDLSVAITKALIDSAIIALSKIYDNNSSGANLISLLHRIDSDKDFIISEKLIEIKTFAKEQEKELNGDKISRLRGNLRVWRDKFYAHIDKDFLNAENSLREDFPISAKEFEQLLEFAKYTLKHLYVLINGHDLLNSPKTRCEAEFDILLDLLEKHRQMHIEAFKSIK